MDAGIQQNTAAGTPWVELPALCRPGVASVTDQHVHAPEGPEPAALDVLQERLDRGQVSVVEADEAGQGERPRPNPRSITASAAENQRLLHQDGLAGREHVRCEVRSDVVGHGDDSGVIARGVDVAQTRGVRDARREGLGPRCNKDRSLPRESRVRSSAPLPPVGGQSTLGRRLPRARARTIDAFPSRLGGRHPTPGNAGVNRYCCSMPTPGPSSPISSMAGG